MQDYFTLLPGDRDHAFFQFLQGNVRTKDYIDTFKFYDFQIIQNAGLSPASFGYETNAYMNVANVDMAKDSSEMSIEAIKTQIEPQINNLITNIVKAQQSSNIQENRLPEELNWDYGNNESLKDEDKIALLKKIINTVSIPYKARIEIVLPILKKLMGADYSNTLDIEAILEEHNKEQDNIGIRYGEI